MTDQDVTPQYYQTFLGQYKGIEELNNNNDKATQMLTDMFINDVHEGYVTELGEIDSIQTVAILNDQLVYYAFTKHNVFEQQVNKHTTDVFTFEGCYSSDTFQGIMPDTGASSVSSAGEP
jgi:hypothetical protein